MHRACSAVVIALCFGTQGPGFEPDLFHKALLSEAKKYYLIIVVVALFVIIYIIVIIVLIGVVFEGTR